MQLTIVEAGLEVQVEVPEAGGGPVRLLGGRVLDVEVAAASLGLEELVALEGDLEALAVWLVATRWRVG
jgi:hypothetical protein